MKNIPSQLELRPALSNVYGTFEYRSFHDTLVSIDELLNQSDLEDQLIQQASKVNSDQVGFTKLETLTAKKYNTLKLALRCNIARHLFSESYRAFSLRLQDSNLLQWFVGINDLSSRKAISKSSLERFEKCFDVEAVMQVIKSWLAGFANEEQAESVGFSEAIDFKRCWLDTTCVKAHIHFPVDWVLLRDAARSLLLAIDCIRAKGLKHRMVEPAVLLKQMNKLCIEMTHCRRKKDSKKMRKKVLRQMKQLSQRIKKHAERYRQLLIDQWQETSWTEAQMHQVKQRIDNILTQLPAAIKQAHERIIGERQLRSSDKLLSLYDHEVAVIVRGKAGSEVEFGQRFLLVEQTDGLIIDWQLYGKQSPQDNHLFPDSIDRLEKVYGSLDAVCTDRGFASKNNDELLKSKEITNATCPRSVAELKEKQQDNVFNLMQTRRGQTEARVGIFKNVFIGRPLRTRVLDNKRHAINWCVLSHNLWVLARKLMLDEQTKLKKAA